MKIKITRDLKIKLLKALKSGYIDTKDFQKEFGHVEQPLFPDIITGMEIK